jgi:hypothetical protein
MQNFYKRSRASATMSCINPFATKDSSGCLKDGNETEDESFHGPPRGSGCFWTREELKQLKFWISSLIESEKAILKQAKKSLGFKIDDSIPTESCSPSYLEAVRAFKKKKAKAENVISCLRKVLDDIKARNGVTHYERRVMEIVALL